MNSKLYLLKIIIIGFIIFIVNYFFYQICFVNGNSMYPTLKNKDVVIVQKYNLNMKKNDIVVIKKNNNIVIKRIVGLPNDSLIIEKGYLYVNNKKFDNLYTKDSGILNNKVKLLKEEYFVLGDNRQSSIDSRFDEIGIINKKDIIGKVIFQ